MQDTNGGNSSGILLYFPFYYIEYSAYTDFVSENNIKHYSSGFNTYGSTHIEYSKVTEFHGSNSKIEYCFSNSANSFSYQDVISSIEVIRDRFHHQLYSSEWIISNDLISRYTAPITSKQAERGKVLEKKTFSSSSLSVPLFAEVNTYNTNKELSVDYLPSYLVRKLGYNKIYIDNYKQTGRIVSELRNGTTVTRGEKYNYNSYGQVVRIATRDSKGDSLITKYQYVWDLNPSQITPSSVYRFMIDHNITSQPLSEMVYIKKGGTGSETLILGKRYTYTNPVTANKAIVRLSKVELYDNTTAGWYTELEYSSFDSKGNILESIDRSGIYTSYVWGYNGLYLVAKVENIGLTTLKSLVSGLSGISETPLTGGIVSGIQSTLRSSSPNSLATLYDYIPFVGLSKVTDPAGKITTYDYNLSGKLKSVKDSKNLPQNTIFYSPDNKL
jgi:YD repeat-containing protein